MKNTMLLVLILLAIAAASCLGGTTYVSGVVSGVWDTSGSPYIVEECLYIYSGDTLNIDAGVEVLFRDGCYIDVGGVLGNLIGDSLNPIIFSGYSDSAQWGIDFSWGDPETIQISNCVFENGKIEWWVYKGGSMTIEQCRFYHSTLSPCGCRVNDCYFTENSLITGNCSCRNCLIADNSTAIFAMDWWDTGFNGDFVSLFNCTVVNNTRAVWTDFPYSYGKVFIRNSIIYGFDLFSNDRVTVSNCILSDSLPYDSTDSYIVADPLFVDPDHGDYHLRDSSIAIGLGDTCYYIPDHDLDGNPRPDPIGSMPDLGCYENPRAIADAIGESDKGFKPLAYSISAYPNPFNSAVRISVETLHATSLRIEIFDLAGRRVAQLPSPSVPLPAGEGRNSFSLWEKVSEGRMRAEFTWQPDATIGSGVYLVRARIGGESVTKRVVYLK